MPVSVNFHDTELQYMKSLLQVETHIEFLFIESLKNFSQVDEFVLLAVMKPCQLCLHCCCLLLNFKNS
jgi:hypothetical protein